MFVYRYYVGMVDVSVQRVIAGVHEGAHAVAHKCGGLRVFSVEVFSSYGGYVHIDEDIGDEDIPAYLVACLAGPEAEVYFLTLFGGHTVRSARREVKDGCLHDYDNFRIFSRFGYVSMGRYRKRASELVVREWDRIVRVGLLVALRGRVDGKDV